MHSVRLGALDGDPGIRPGAHQFTAYAAPWPRFPERIPPDARRRLATKPG